MQPFVSAEHHAGHQTAYIALKEAFPHWSETPSGRATTSTSFSPSVL